MSLAATTLPLPLPTAEIKPATPVSRDPSPRTRQEDAQAPSFDKTLQQAAKKSDPPSDAAPDTSKAEAKSSKEKVRKSDASDESQASPPTASTDEKAPPATEDPSVNVAVQGLTEGLIVTPTGGDAPGSAPAPLAQEAPVVAQEISGGDATKQALANPLASASVQSSTALDPKASPQTEPTSPVAVLNQDPGAPSLQAQPHAQGQTLAQQQDAPSQTSSSRKDQKHVMSQKASLEVPVQSDASASSSAPAPTGNATVGEAVAVAPSALRTQPGVPIVAEGLTAEASTPSDSVNTARIARGLTSVIQQNGGAVTLRLTPADLGTIRIQLQIHSGTVNAQFQASTESARQVLTQQLTQLRSALEGQGLVVDRLSVQSPSSSTSSQAQQHADSSPGDGRSRGEYTGQQGQSRQGASEQQGQGSNHEPRSLFERLFPDDSPTI